MILIKATERNYSNIKCLDLGLTHNSPSRQEEKKILDTVMGSTVYDSRIRPNGMNDTDAATLVTVNLFVRSFSKIDDVKMVIQNWEKFRIRLIFRCPYLFNSISSISVN